MQPRTRGKIFTSLKPGTIEIHVAYGFGHNNGGGLQRVKRNIVPINCRFPNSYVWLTIELGEIVKVEKMTEQEAMVNAYPEI